MNCVDNNNIFVTGICDPTVFDLSQNNYWTQITVPETVTVPKEKPDIEQIDSVNIDVDIFRQKVIVTPRSDSFNQEGKRLTGRKLIVEGNLCEAITYVACDEKQTVHTAHFKVPFSAFIVLPRWIEFGDDSSTTRVPVEEVNFDVKACVEDVFIEDFTKRKIFKNVVLFLQAIPVSVGICEEDKCKCLDQNIEIRGVCSPEKLADMLGEGEDTWTQIEIPEFLSIPCQKPDIEQLISVTTSVKIFSQRIIKTPVSEEENEEGTKLTGRKLILEGVLRQKILYTADVPEQSVHAAHFDVPFSVFIVLPGDTLLSSKYKIEPCIEDIFVCAINKREIFKNVTLLLRAKKIQEPVCV